MEGYVVYYRSKEGDTVDLIAWRYYGRQNDLIVERVIEANPGIADEGPVLPAGLRLALPDIPEENRTASVRLWG